MNINHDETLTVITTVRDGLIQAGIEEQRHRTRLMEALRGAHESGVPVDDLSSASGLTTDQIRSGLAL
jgi:hypothetical protein